MLVTKGPLKPPQAKLYLNLTQCTMYMNLQILQHADTYVDTNTPLVSFKRHFCDKQTHCLNQRAHDHSNDDVIMHF